MFNNKSTYHYKPIYLIVIKWNVFLVFQIHVFCEIVFLLSFYHCPIMKNLTSHGPVSQTLNLAFIKGTMFKFVRIFQLPIDANELSVLSTLLNN